MQIITIAGKAFKAVTDSTLEHDMWTLQQLQRSGIDTIVMEEGESADNFAQRMLIQLLTNGTIFDLLGGLLMPASLKGADWTPEIAAESAKLFARTTGDEKILVRKQIAGAMESFLAAGLLSSIRSRRSSALPIPESMSPIEVQMGSEGGQISFGK